MTSIAEPDIDTGVELDEQAIFESEIPCEARSPYTGDPCGHIADYRATVSCYNEHVRKRLLCMCCVLFVRMGLMDCVLCERAEAVFLITVDRL